MDGLDVMSAESAAKPALEAYFERNNDFHHSLKLSGISPFLMLLNPREMGFRGSMEKFDPRNGLLFTLFSRFL